MSNLYQNFWDELFVKIATVLPELTIQYTPMETSRIDWVNLVKDGTLVLPYSVVGYDPYAKADWGLTNKCETVPLTMFYVSQSKPKITDVTTGAASATQALDSVVGLAPGMRLWFGNTGTYRIIQTVGASSVTLTSTVTTTTGMDVGISYTAEWLDSRLRTLKDELLLSTYAPTYFQVDDDPEIDTSSANPVNVEVAKSGNYAIEGASLRFSALIGEGYS